MLKVILRAVLIGPLALAASGCMTPNPQPLDTARDVPGAFTAPRADANAPVWPQANWWVNFRSSELPVLIERAQSDNLDVAQAAARVLQAEASSRITYSGILPKFEGGLGASRRDNGAGTTNSFSATISGSYLVDYLGQNRNLYASARETLRATRYNQDAISLAIQSAVAETYFTILALREQTAISRRNVDAARQLLVITQAKFNTGVSSNRDVAQQQVAVSREEGRLPLLAEQERQARYTLAVLMGMPPEGFNVSAQSLDGIASPNVKGGVPSDLLARRPDIAQAEANLYAAHANVDAARALFFPRIGISGSAGWGAAAIDTLINPGNLLWNVGASLVQTIFDGGNVAAQNDLARAQQAELIAKYRHTVFLAFQDAEGAIGTVQSGNERLGFATTESDAAMEGYRVSELQYREGTIDITALLSAQQQLFSAQSSLIDAKLSRLIGNVRLYIALGGGWQQLQADEGYPAQTALASALRGMVDD